MYQKILWKIEALWHHPYKNSTRTSLNLSQNYGIDGISLSYPRFLYVEKFKSTFSKNPVFNDEYGKYYGLENGQLINQEGKNIYIFDNHNEILYPFVEVYEKTKYCYDVVHIDAHKDDALFLGEKPSSLTLKTVGAFIPQTRISDFFDALSKTKIIGDIFRITHSESFQSFLLPQKPFILSLDIDIFGPEGNFIALEEKIKIIRQAWNNADVVCIATSPGFIDQAFAHEIIKIFLQSRE